MQTAPGRAKQLTTRHHWCSRNGTAPLWPKCTSCCTSQRGGTRRGSYSHRETFSCSDMGMFQGIPRSPNPAGDGQQLGRCGAAQARPRTTQGACCLYETDNKAGYHPGSSCIRCQWPCGGLPTGKKNTCRHCCPKWECKVWTQQLVSLVLEHTHLTTNVEQTYIQEALKHVWIKVKRVFKCCPRSYPLQNQGLCLWRLLGGGVFWYKMPPTAPRQDILNPCAETGNYPCRCRGFKDSWSHSSPENTGLYNCIVFPDFSESTWKAHERGGERHVKTHPSIPQGENIPQGIYLQPKAWQAGRPRWKLLWGNCVAYITRTRGIKWKWQAKQAVGGVRLHNRS